MLAHFGHHLISALLQPLLPLIRDEFKLNYAQSGWLVSAFTLAYGLSQLPAGWAADKIGPRLLIAIGISGVALAGLLVGLSPSYTITFVPLIVMGILGGGYHPSAAPLVSKAVEAKNRGRALGLHQIGGTASNFVAPLIAVPVAVLFGSWRWSFVSLAVIIFIFGVMFYLLLGRLQSRDSSNGKPAETRAADKSGEFRINRLAPFIILGIVVQVATFSTISFVPLFAVDKLHTSEGVGASLIALAQVAGLWAGPAGGYLSDRIGKTPVMLSVALAAGPLVYLMSRVSLGWTISVVLLILGICQYVAMPVSEAYIISHSPENNRSTVLGFYYFASRGGPGLLMPAMGRLSDKYGFNTAFWVVGIATLTIVVVCSLFLWRNRD